MASQVSRGKSGGDIAQRGRLADAEGTSVRQDSLCISSGITSTEPLIEAVKSSFLCRIGARRISGGCPPVLSEPWLGTALPAGLSSFANGDAISQEIEMHERTIVEIRQCAIEVARTLGEYRRTF